MAEHEKLAMECMAKAEVLSHSDDTDEQDQAFFQLAYAFIHATLEVADQLKRLPVRS